MTPRGFDKPLYVLPFAKEESMTPNSDNGIVNTPSSHSVDQTVEKLEAMLRAKGVALFALVDHSGEAAKAGE